MEYVLEVFVGMFDVGKVVAVGFLWTGEDDTLVGMNVVISSIVAWYCLIVDYAVAGEVVFVVEVVKCGDFKM